MTTSYQRRAEGGSNKMPQKKHTGIMNDKKAMLGGMNEHGKKVMSKHMKAK